MFCMYLSRLWRFRIVTSVVFRGYALVLRTRRQNHDRNFETSDNDEDTRVYTIKKVNNNEIIIY